MLLIEGLLSFLRCQLPLLPRDSPGIGVRRRLQGAQSLLGFFHPPGPQRQGVLHGLMARLD